MKFLSVLILFILPFNPNPMKFYDFELTSIDGKPIDLNLWKGKHVLLVNVASECGYTPQYEGLQQLHEQYGHLLEVVGIPANDFGGQEPGTDEQISAFCEKNYGVSFTMASKIKVTGAQRHPLYAWLEEQTGKTPTWNFCKYLISPNGEVLDFFPSQTHPLEEAITGKL